MSLFQRLVARLGIDCGLPAAGVQRAWLAADALADKEAEEDVAEPMDDLAVQRFLREEAELDRLRDTLRTGGIAAWERELTDFPAGVEPTPAPPAGLTNECRHCSLPSWVVHCPNGVTQAMCQHHGFISTERK